MFFSRVTKLTSLSNEEVRIYSTRSLLHHLLQSRKIGLTRAGKIVVSWSCGSFSSQPTLSTNLLFLYLEIHRELNAQKAILPRWLKLRKTEPVEEISSWIRCYVVCKTMAWTNWNTYHFYTQSVLFCIKMGIVDDEEVFAQAL